jgi:alkylhydroperoxidase family enzyme
MAYINFSEFQPELNTREAAPAVERASGFSGLEWSVIALAQRDRLGSLRQPGRIATALGTLFGAWQNPRLADGRLEALRRIAVLAWHKSYALPVSELRAFLAAGFSAEQYEMLQASISRGRIQNRRQSA